MSSSKKTGVRGVKIHKHKIEGSVDKKKENHTFIFWGMCLAAILLFACIGVISATNSMPQDSYSFIIESAPDTTPPATVTDLATGSSSSHSITLTWTALGDDENTGTATKYDIRYSTSEITEANWDSAIQCTDEPTPKEAGSTETFTVTGLSPDTTYYFALKTADEVPNWSDISNSASGTTTEAVVELAGYWKFDEGLGNTAQDSSGNNNDGTIQGASWTEGKQGKGLSFDGTNDYVDCGLGSSLKITGAITVGAWVKWESPGNHYFVTKLGRSGRYSYDLSGNTDGTVEFRVSCADGSSLKSSGTITIPAGEWVYLVGTYEPSSYVRLFVNGALAKEDTASIPAAQGDNGLPWYIGDREGNQGYFDGIIDEVKIYNSALTPEEVRADYEAGSLNQPPTAIIESITPDIAEQGKETVAFSGHGTDTDGTVVAYNWRSSREGQLSTASSFGKSASELSVGTHTIYFKVQDDKGAWSTEVTGELTINHEPENIMPVADPKGPYTGTEGIPMDCDGSNSYDTDGSVVAYEWDFGDGNIATGVAPTHTYAQNGTYTVTLTVTDNDGAIDTNTTTATIAETEPTVDFSATPTSGQEALTVSFTDNSTSYDGIVGWNWDFNNDGETDSTVQNPTHKYAEEGVYTVSLSVTESDGDNDTLTKVEYITVIKVNEPPVADPNGPYMGTEGVPIAYDGSGSYDTDGSIVAYDWDFGDGDTATGVAPTHTYAQNGTYTVTLKVTDNDGATNTITTTATIADTEPTAAFSATPNRGEEPLTVTFTDNSTSHDGIEAWDWDFDNDGETDSTGQNPTHVYAEDGVYTVSLTVYESDGDSDTITKVDYITVIKVNEPPVSNLGGPYTGTEGVPIIFDGSTSSDPDGRIVAYEWDFGDGDTATGEVPTHTYAQEGTYTITLKVTDNEGAINTRTTTATIADTEPTADFYASPTSGDGPLTVAFIDNSTSYDGIETLEWDFDNDGETDSTEQNPTHDYAEEGVYTVSLTVTESDGCSDTMTKTDYITVTEASKIEYIWLEAEDADIITPDFETVSDLSASNGKYIQIPEGVGFRAHDGEANYRITVDSPGDYIVWGSKIAATGGDNSFFVQIDDGTKYLWAIALSDNWQWDAVNHWGSGGEYNPEIDPLVFTLSAGEHTLKIIQREDGAKLDELLITNDMSYVPVSNNPPTAIIDSITPDIAEQGKETVAFSGHGTDTDGSVVAYNWRSDVDGQISTASSFSKPASELSVGTHTIYFTVQDDKGAWSTEVTKDLTLIEPANQAPVADPSGPYTGTEGFPIDYDGSGSYDPDGSIVAYEWDFGDGDTATGEVPTHTYAQEGTYTITLKVTDNEGAINTRTTTATIADTEPTADFYASPTSGDGPLTVAFIDNSTSYDGIETLEWDFDNDGETDSTEQNPTHDYAEEGVYTVSLTVTESDGCSDTMTKTDYITVTEASKIEYIWLEAEDADIITPDFETVSDLSASNGKYIQIPEGVGFRAHDGEANYRITVDSPGDYIVWGSKIAATGGDNSFFVQIDDGTKYLWAIALSDNWQWDAVNHWGSGGEYNPEIDPLVFTLSAGEHTLKIIQREDGAKLDELLITNDMSYVPVSNNPPTAIIDSITPDIAEQGKETVAFSGHGTDTDGSVVAYNWRSDVDGQISTASSFSKPASELSVGTHTIYFTVQDDKGAWSTEVTKDLTLIEPANQAPVADPSGPYTGTEGFPIDYDGSGSYDPDGSIVAYEWDFGDGDTATGEVPTHTYAQEGTYTITLKVTDNEGAINTRTTTATIADTEPTADFYASPTSGDGPLTVAFIDNSTSYDGIETLEWDFDNDGETDSTEQNPTHDYAEEGVYTVSLTVTESDGCSDTMTKTDYITVTEASKIEYIWLEAEDADIITPDFETVSDLSASNGKYIQIPEGVGFRAHDGEANYRITVDSPGDYIVWGSKIAATGGDNSFFVQIDDGTKYLWAIALSDNWQWDAVNHWGSGGEYNPEIDPLVFTLSAGEHTLKIIQREDGAKLDELLITNDMSYVPVSNNPPTAIIDSITPDIAEQGKETVAFSGHGTDTDGSVVAYNWRSDVDGQISTASSFSKPASELSVGTHTIYFTVQDDKGAWSTEVTKDLTLIEPANQAPVADPSGPYTGTEGFPIDYDGSGSYDPDGSIVAYEWDFGDGDTATGVAPTHTYAQNGTYTVTLKVTDNDGATNTITTTATIADTEPTAAFSATRTHGPEPLTVAFTDNSASYDGIETWAWDFDNDGVADSTEQNPTYVYIEYGRYTVILTVTESDGDSGTMTKADYITVIIGKKSHRQKPASVSPSGGATDVPVDED